MKDIRWKYRSHTTIGKENIIRVVTGSGEIEISKWIKEAEELAVVNEEEHILNKLYEFCAKELAWLKMKEFNPRKNIEELEEEEAKQIIKEVEEQKKKYRYKLDNDIKEMALQYYCSRIWENAEWVDYELFNNLYLLGEMQLTMK